MRINFRNYRNTVVLVWDCFGDNLAATVTSIPKRSAATSLARSLSAKSRESRLLARDRAQSFNQRLALCAIVDNECVVFAMR